MQRMRRGLPVLAFLLLFVCAGPAFAIDQSATEETSCLMACDAHQENCQAMAHGPSGRAAGNPVWQTLLSRSLRKGAYFSQANRSVALKERPRQ